MSACVPVRVRVAVPFAPDEIAAPPLNVTATVPLVTESWTVVRFPSTSLTDNPEMASRVSTATVWVPGTVLIGASLTAVTLKVRVLGAVSYVLLLSRTEKVKLV